MLTFFVENSYTSFILSTFLLRCRNIKNNFRHIDYISISSDVHD